MVLASFCEFCDVCTDSLGQMYGHLHLAHKDFGVMGYKEGYSIKYKNQNGNVRAIYCLDK